MRFVILRKADRDTEAGAPATPALVDAMLAYHQEMVQAGVLKGGDGLKPSALGTRLKFKDGKPTLVDGPFAETKELIAGYTVIEVKSREEALAWAARWPPLDGNGEVELEVRPLYEVEDFGEAFSPEARALEKRQREEMAR